MSVWPRIDRWRRVGAVALLACIAATGARAYDDAEGRVRELLDARELGEALTACDAISDARLRAEWRFAVLYAGGDLSGALDVALEGLEHAPGHAGLGQNALICALRLRSSEAAAKVRAQLAETPPELVEALDALSELEGSAASRTLRARMVALGTLLAAIAALVLFARRADR